MVTNPFASNMTATDVLVESLLPRHVAFPFYHVPRESLIPGVSDAASSVIAPFFAYWIVSIFFTIVDKLEIPAFERHRIHEPEELTKRNRVTPREVVKAVLLQQLIQTALGLVYLDEGAGYDPKTDYREEMRPYARVLVKLATVVLGQKEARRILTTRGSDAVHFLYWWGVPALQFLWASFVMDTWQYFWHRAFHVNKWLYRNIHSVHHRLYVPYSYGALYNHPVEGFILDSLGAVIAHMASFMTIRQAIVLFAFSTAKTVDDHCGFALPWDPFQFLFGNNADYHDIHHQQFGIKRNFSQPYFIHWDVVLGTRMTREEASTRRRGKKALPHTDGRDPLVKKLVNGEVEESEDGGLKME